MLGIAKRFFNAHHHARHITSNRLTWRKRLVLSLEPLRDWRGREQFQLPDGDLIQTLQPFALGEAHVVLARPPLGGGLKGGCAVLKSARTLQHASFKDASLSKWARHRNNTQTAYTELKGRYTVECL